MKNIFMNLVPFRVNPVSTRGIVIIFLEVKVKLGRFPQSLVPLNVDNPP